MPYVYRHFIPQNIAPKSAVKIGVYDSNGKSLGSLPLGGLKPDTKEKLYSFGLVSDIHLYHLTTEWNPNPKFDNALSYFEKEGCAFCVVCGDLTQTGLYMRTVENDPSTTYYDESQMSKYKEICQKHTIPVYELMGNHESYYNMPISDNLDKMKQFTDNELYYKVEYQNDIFILCGHPRGSDPMSDEAFTFLSETLAANSHKRCFVFVHPVWNDDSGDANGLYSGHSTMGGTLLTSWSNGEALKTLLRQYPKTVLFHGHTHIKFQEQEKDKDLNYTQKNGFHSVHIPSLGRPRNIINNELKYVPADSQGYMVDVYEDCIVLIGMDFVKNEPVPQGVLKIDISTTE